MKTSNARLSYFLYVFACLLTVFISGPDPKVFAQTGLKPDIVIRMADINEALLTIEQLAGQNQSQKTMFSPKGFVDGFLKGTDWLDSNRSLVLGVILDENSMEKMPQMAAIVPFSEPNQEFAQAYNALSRNDYYLIPLPSGGNTKIADDLESALEIASKKPSERFLSIDIAAARALKKAEGSIEQMVKSIGEKAQQKDSQTDAIGGGSLEVKQAEALLTGFCDLLKQVENFSLGLDLNRRDIEILSELNAVQGSDFADFINAQQQAGESVLGAFELSSDPGIRFRTTPFDMSGATVFAEKYFGDFYRLAGIDFESAGPVTEPFSGETAGVIEIEPSGLIIEAVSCIKPEHKLSPEFLESEYIPWLLDAGQSMTETYQSQYPSFMIEPVFVRADSSTVADIPVFGVEGRIPVIQKDGGSMRILRMPLRMAIMDHYMLLASDDVRMAGLIDRVAGLEPAAYKGPFVHMTMNLAKLISAGAAMAPEVKKVNTDDIPDMGEIEYTVELAEQKLVSRYRLNTEDVVKLKDYFAAATVPADKQLHESGRRAPDEKSFLPAGQKDKSIKETQHLAGNDASETVHEQFSKDQPRYWTEKGGLYLAYGNTEAAVRHFEKAVEMAPENPAAHYNLGLAYSEKDALEKALKSIEHSLTLDPGNGRYLYAKGWILMQTGDRENGLAAIEQAAGSGNADALRYLKQVASRH